MSEVRIDRLQMLVDELRKESGVEFDMGHTGKRWGRRTSGCALLRAAMIPEFQKSGWSICWPVSQMWCGMAFARISINGDPSSLGVAGFFGLTLQQVYDLFYTKDPSDRHRILRCTAAEKADQIEALIREVRGE